MAGPPGKSLNDVSSHPSRVFAFHLSGLLLPLGLGDEGLNTSPGGAGRSSEVRCWEAGPQQVRLSKDPSPSHRLGLGSRGGVQPASLAPPPGPLLLLSLCRNQKIPVQRQEMGLFLALWGKKPTLPFCSKIYGVCAGQARS